MQVQKIRTTEIKATACIRTIALHMVTDLNLFTETSFSSSKILIICQLETVASVFEIACCWKDDQNNIYTIKNFL